MTEIPEHLLKRSRERRSAMGGDAGSGDGGGASESTGAAPAAAAATPAKAAPSMPAHPDPEPVPTAPPPSPMVEAHRRRRKIPFWAMPVLAALPVWAYVYQGTLSPPPAGEGPETIGEELFASSGCAGCHGAGGSGSGSFPGFTDGRIFETWPSFVEHFEWVRLGSNGWRTERGDTYGANGKPVNGGMPGFGEDQLSDADLLYVVLYERSLGGENPDEEDATQLEEVALLMSENEGMTLEEALEEVGVEAPTASEGGSSTAGGETAPENAPETEDTPGSEGNEQPSDGGEADQTGDTGTNSGVGPNDNEPPQSAGGDNASP